MVRVLVVEDNPVNQRLMQAILRSAGYDHALATNGLEGVQTAQNEPFDVVLMDLLMPVLDGYEATKRLRETFAPAELPIIAVSATMQAGGRDRAMAAGCNHFIAKPFTKQDLLDYIRGYKRCQINNLRVIAEGWGRARSVRHLSYEGLHIHFTKTGGCQPQNGL